MTTACLRSTGNLPYIVQPRVTRSGAEQAFEKIVDTVSITTDYFASPGDGIMVKTLFAVRP